MTFKDAFRRYPLLQFVLYFVIWFLIDWSISDRDGWKHSMYAALFYSVFMVIFNEIIFQPLIPLYFKKELYEEMCRYVEEMGYRLKKEKKGIRYYRKSSLPMNYRSRIKVNLTTFYSSIEIPQKMQDEVEAKIEEMNGRLY